MASWQLPYKVLNTSPCSYVHCAAVPDVAIQTTALKKTCPYKFLLSVNLLVLAGHQPLDRRKWPPVLKPTYRNIPNGCKQCSIIIARPLRMFRFFRQRDLETDYLQLWPEPLYIMLKAGEGACTAIPDLQSASVHAQCDQPTAPIFVKIKTGWILEARVLNGRFSISSKAPPGLRNVLELIFGSEHDLISSGTKPEPIIVLRHHCGRNQK